MREEQSDLILNLVHNATQVESEIEIHTGEVADRLGETFAPIFETWEEGQEKPDFQATLRALKDKLGDSREKLSLAEERLIGLIRQAVELRDERQELMGGLYDDFSSMRRTVEELYRGKGKDNVNAFVVAGIQGPTAQRPTKLLRQIDLAILHLQQPGLEFPVSRFGETRLEPSKLANVLKPRCDRLHQVQSELRGVGSEMNASRKQKNRALEAHKETFLWVAQGAEALFHLAGEHELAKRVRTSTHRPGRRDDEVAGGQGESQAESSAVAGDSGSGDQPAGEPQPTDSPVAVAAPEFASSSSPADG